MQRRGELPLKHAPRAHVLPCRLRWSNRVGIGRGIKNWGALGPRDVSLVTPYKSGYIVKFVQHYSDVANAAVSSAAVTK